MTDDAQREMSLRELVEKLPVNLTHPERVHRAKGEYDLLMEMLKLVRMLVEVDRQIAEWDVLRKAMLEAYERITGTPPRFCFAGWSETELTPWEQKIAGGRERKESS